MEKEMRPILAFAILAFAISGCGNKQPIDTSQQQLTSAARKIRGDLKGVSNLVVIGSVIGSKGSLVEAVLKREGILCVCSGGEFYSISVPDHCRQRAIEILKHNSENNGYQIQWEIP